MADTFIQVATDGSGKKLDTRTEATNSEHRQVIVLGDPATNAGVAPVDATTGLAVKAMNTLGAGASDASTIRVTIDSSQVDSTAHGASDSGSPAKVGGRAVAGRSSVTPVTAGQRTDSLFTTDGALYVQPWHALEDIIAPVKVTCTAGANTSAVAAQGASLRIYVTGMTIFNNGTSNGNIILTDGTGGTTRAMVPYPASTGTVWKAPTPIPFTLNTAVFADPTGSDNIDIVVYGFKSKI